MTDKLIETKGLAFSPKKIRRVSLCADIYDRMKDGEIRRISIEYHDKTDVVSASFASFEEAETERQRLISEINAASEPPATPPLPDEPLYVVCRRPGAADYTCIDGPTCREGIDTATGMQAHQWANRLNAAFMLGRSHQQNPLPDEPSEAMIGAGADAARYPIVQNPEDIAGNVWAAMVAAHKREHSS